MAVKFLLATLFVAEVVGFSGDDVGASIEFSPAGEATQIAAICASFFVASAVLIYVISVFGMRERTFEEALEEQRKRQREAPLSSIPIRSKRPLSKSVGAIGAKAEKKKKEGKKRVVGASPKTNGVIPSPPPLTTITKKILQENTTFSADAVSTISEKELDQEESAIVDTVPTALRLAKKKKKGKKNGANSEDEVETKEIVLPEKLEACILKNQGSVHLSYSERRDLPNGDVSREKEIEIETTLKIESKEDGLSTPAAPATPAAAVNGSIFSATEEEIKEKRRKKKKDCWEETYSSATSEEEQILKLKQSLDERDKMLAENKLLNGRLQTKLGENRALLKTERGKAVECEARLAETAEKSKIDLQSLDLRMQQQQREFQAERNNLQLKINSMQEKLQEAAAQAQTHHGRLQQLQNENKSWREASERGRKDFDGRLKKLEDESRRSQQAAVDETKSHYVHQVKDLQDQLQQTEGYRTTVANELAQLQKEFQRAKTRATELENNLGLRETQVSQLNSQLTEAENARNALDTRLKTYETRLQDALAQRQEAEDKAKSAHDKLEAAKGAKIAAEASPSNQKETEREKNIQLENTLKEMKARVAKKDEEVSRLRAELANLESLIASLSKSTVDENSLAKLKSLESELEGKKYLESELEILKKEKQQLESNLEETKTNKGGYEAESDRLVASLKQMRSRVAQCLADEESTATVAGLAVALKSSCADLNLPSEVDLAGVFNTDLIAALERLVNKQTSVNVDDYLRQIEALKVEVNDAVEALEATQQALSVQIEDEDDKIREDDQGELFVRLQSELDEAKSSLLTQQKSRIADATIIKDLETTLAETKERLEGLERTLDQETKSSVKLQQVVEEKEREIVDLQARLKTQEYKAEAERHAQIRVQEEIEATAAKLHQDVDHYKNVLSETEAMLNKLQTSVESEAKRWSERLRAKEEAARSAALKSEELQLRLDALDAAFAVERQEKNALVAEHGEDRQERDQLREALEAETKLKLEALEAERQLETRICAERAMKLDLESRLAEAVVTAAESKSLVEKLSVESEGAKGAVAEAAANIDRLSLENRRLEAETDKLRRKADDFEVRLKEQAVAAAIPAATPKKDKEKEKKSTDPESDAASVGEGGEEKKKKGKSLAKLFSPKSK